MTEKDYIDGLITGDEETFRRFVEQNQLKLLKLCNGFVHNREDARDLVQEIFIEVYQSVHNFREDSKLSTWLYRIAVNKSLNFVRRNRRKLFSRTDTNTGNKTLTNEIKCNYLTPDTKLEQHQRDGYIQKAVDSLNNNQRIAFVLNKYDDLSYKEISEIMDISVSAVESLIHRAKTNLQKKLYHLYKKNLI